MRKSQSSEQTFTDQLLQKGRSIPEELLQAPGTILRLVRRRMRMTQVQLAKKSGVRQSNIAAIESGKKQPTLPTLRKLFEALGFELAILPVARIPVDRILQEKAKKKAEKSLQELFSTMALEDQLPSKRKRSELIQEEAWRLMEEKPSKVWDDA